MNQSQPLVSHPGGALTSLSRPKVGHWLVSSNPCAPLAMQSLLELGCQQLEGKTLVCAKGLRALSLQRSPGHVASQILPEALQSPDHMQLPIRKMFQEAIADEPRDILPIVVAFVSQFLLKHGANGNDCCERISEDDKLQKE